MRATFTKILTIALLAAPLAVLGLGPEDRAAALCFFGCDPTEADARTIFENLLKKRFDKPAKIVSFQQTMAERLRMHATGEKGYEIFFKATAEFPEGANLDCKPTEAGEYKEGCSPSKHYVTAPRAVDPKGRQYVAPGATIEFTEEYRFYEAENGWKGPDGNIYTR